MLAPLTRRFSEDGEYAVFPASLKAGGVGLNLTGGGEDLASMTKDELLSLLED